MKIGLDVMGGDFAPRNCVLGAIDAYPQIGPDCSIVLFGDKPKIEDICSKMDFDSGKFEIVHCSQFIKMDENPVKAYAKKHDSSMVVGMVMLSKGGIDAFASAGSTGAMLAGCVGTLKPIVGIIRPCISVEVPLINDKRMLILDVGFNTDCKPDVLYQFGALGSIYAKEMMSVPKPRVALLNIGEEEERGSMAVKEAYKLMMDSSYFDFVGNIEANQLFTGDIADVVVTDGFSGNILLKQAEGMYDMARRVGIENEYFDRFNYENYGGIPVLGVPSPVIIGHGASTSLAVSNMILQAEKALNNRLTEKIKEAISNG